MVDYSLGALLGCLGGARHSSKTLQLSSRVVSANADLLLCQETSYVM